MVQPLRNPDADKRTRLTIDLDPDERKKLRLLGSLHDASMVGMVRLMIAHYYTEMAQNGQKGVANFFGQNIGDSNG